MHWPDRLQVLRYHGFETAATFVQVAVNAAQDTQIGVRIHEHADIHEVPELTIGED
jgi:hypothetical protein